MELIQTKSYKEWRESNNPFIYKGLPFFTGGLAEDIYTDIQEFIDLKFKRHYIGFTDDEEMLDEMQCKLKEIEYTFFSLYKLTYNKEIEELWLKYRKEVSKGESSYKNTNTNTSSSTDITDTTSNLTSDSSQDTTSNSSVDTTDNSTNNTTSDNLTKNRVLNSVYPNSNVSQDISTDIDSPVSWKFATNSTDGFDKLDSTVRTTVNSEVNTNTNSADNVTINSSNTERSNVDNTKASNSKTIIDNSSLNDYSKDIKEYDPKLYLDFLNGLRSNSCFTYLFNELRRLFLYVF